jgi:hypothetical protein
VTEQRFKAPRGCVVTEQDPTKLLTAAAKSVLRPLGLRQRGKSRIWLDDHGWWVVVVEFQPGRSKGSYLNVGAMWLWFEKSYISFDYGSRIEPFTPFESELQFESAAASIAKRAAEEVIRLRSLFATLNQTAEVLASQAQMGFWDYFNAGVACGLAGDPARSHRFLAEVVNTEEKWDWAQSAASIARSYLSELQDLPTFKDRIRTVIGNTRQQLLLPEIADIPFDETGR